MVRRELAQARQSLGETAEGVAIECFLAWCYDLDTNAALAGLDRAVTLDPVLQTAHGWRCLVVAARGDTAALDPALAALERLDNVSPYALGIAAAALEMAGRYEEAIARGRKALAIEPSSFLAAFATGTSEAACGRLDAAVQVLERATSYYPGASFLTSLLAWACAAAGDAARAREILGGLEQRAQSEYIAPAFLAWVYGELGDMVTARARLAAAMAERAPTLGLARSTPFRCFAAEPTYIGILKRLAG